MNVFKGIKLARGYGMGNARLVKKWPFRGRLFLLIRAVKACVKTWR